MQDAALQAQLVSLAHAAVTAVQRHAGSTTVSAAAVQVLLRLSDCSLCGSQLSRDKQDELCAAGVVPAVVAALGTLCTMPAPPSAVAASTAAGSDGAEQQQPASQAPAISEGVQALQCMCAAHAGNLGQLAAAGGVQAVAAAISAASTEWPAEEQGLLLLAQLACREGATPAEQQAAAAAIWQSAQAQVERRCDRPGLAAVGYAAAGVPCTSGCRCAICLPARPPVACVLETSSHSAPPPPPPLQAGGGWACCSLGHVPGPAAPAAVVGRRCRRQQPARCGAAAAGHRGRAGHAAEL